MWNNFKTTILLAAMSGLVLGIGELWGGQNGLILALVIAAVMNLGSYFFSDKIALASSGAQPISREAGPADLSDCRTPGCQSEHPGSQDLLYSHRFAQRVCHGPQSQPCLGGGDARNFGHLRRRGN